MEGHRPLPRDHLHVVRKSNCMLPRTVTRVTGLPSLVRQSNGMTRVTMPSRDSPRSVDPDDVQVAEVDTLFIQQGRAGAALGAAGCTGRGFLSSAVCPCAELSTQDGWGEKEQISRGVPLEARGVLHHRIDTRTSKAEQTEPTACPQQGTQRERALYLFPPSHDFTFTLLPYRLSKRLHKCRRNNHLERELPAPSKQPSWKCVEMLPVRIWVGFCMTLSRTASSTCSGLKLTEDKKARTK